MAGISLTSRHVNAVEMMITELCDVISLHSLPNTNLFTTTHPAPSSNSVAISLDLGVPTKDHCESESPGHNLTFGGSSGGLKNTERTTASIT